MTPNNTPTTATNGQTSSERNKTGRSSKAGGRGQGGGRGMGADQGESSGRYGGAASRLMSQGRQALGGAYGWASEAGRSFPRASEYVPDRSTLRNLFEERPLVIGAIGLGLGAVIGMMMPSRLMGGNSSGRGRSGGSSNGGSSSGSSSGRSSGRRGRSPGRSKSKSK
jgi:hypothetical protein